MAVNTFVTQLSGRIFDNTSGGSPVEIWSMTYHFQGTDTLTTTDFASDAATKWVAVWDDAAMKIHQTVELDLLKCSQIDLATGQWLDDPVVQEVLGPVRGNATSPTFPTFVSSRVSFDDSTRNRRAKGGFYVPRVAITCENNGHWNTTQVSALGGAWQTFLGTTLPSGLAYWKLGVYSRAGGTFYASNRLRIGNVPDVIRRRKNDLIETYDTSTL